MDFGSQEHMSSFPIEVGDWKGYDYDTTKDKKQLGADVMLLRGYSSAGFYVPIFFLVMQSKTETSFHPPHICYAGQGFKVQEEGEEHVLITGTSWTKSSPNLTVPLKKLVLLKESEGTIIERRLVLFCYVKGNQFTSDTITMIRVEALVPIDGSYEGMLNVEKDFVAQSIPYMFDPIIDKEWNPLALKLVEFGAIGYVAIAFILAFPLAILIYTSKKWGQISIGKPEDEA